MRGCRERRSVGQEKRISIRRRLGGDARTDRQTGGRLILDHDRSTPAFAKPLRKLPGHNVVEAAGAPRYDPHVSARVLLRRKWRCK
jgi:hypothetical protein